MNKSIRNISTNLSLLFGSMLLFIVAVEIILRLIGFSNPNFYTYNDIVGHRLHPGTGGWFRQEGEAYIRINSDGLRDREHSIPKPPNTVRVAILGDSYAEAFQVALADTFWSVMERDLNACKPFGKKQIEVINFGIAGDGTAQELLTLRHYAWKYRPDIILLAFVTGNDVRNNSRILEPQKLRPFFVLQDHELRLDNSFIHHPLYQRKTGRLWSTYRTVSRYVRIFQLCNAVKKKKWYTSVRQNRKTRVQGSEIGLDDAIYMEPKSPEWQEAWKITEALLRSMRDEIARHQAQFIIVTLSNGIQVHPDPGTRRHFMKQLSVTDLFYPDNRIKQFCEEAGISVLPLAPLLQQYAEIHKVYLHGFENTTPGFGHWNAKGHHLAGKLIADFFCSELSDRRSAQDPR